MLTALLFDLGGTVLVERSYDLGNGFNAISKHLTPSVTFDNLQCEIERSQRALSEFSIFEWIKANSVFEPAQVIENTLWDACVCLEPQKGVGAALEQLSTSGLRMAAVSNAIFSSACISRELLKHDLLRYFEFVLSSADLGIRKPHPDIFISALDRMRVAASQAIYIGDNEQVDIAGSEAVGITPVLFGQALTEYSCATLSDWSDTTALRKLL